jgi:NAD(P)H-hydrate epimerase
LITPHPGEAARLLGITSKEVQSERLRSLRELSQRYGNTWVVLKGHQTLIGRSEGNVYVNSSGNPHLAQGGSGDLLSGYLIGLLAQVDLQHDALTTIRYAVWQHGGAADRLQKMRSNWVIEDLARELGRY